MALSALAKMLLLLTAVARAGASHPSSTPRHILFLMVDEMDGKSAVCVAAPTYWVCRTCARPCISAVQAAHAPSPTSGCVRCSLPYCLLQVTQLRLQCVEWIAASSPQCVPGRASMLTGRMVHQIQAFARELVGACAEYAIRCRYGTTGLGSLPLTATSSS